MGMLRILQRLWSKERTRKKDRSVMRSNDVDLIINEIDLHEHPLLPPQATVADQVLPERTLTMETSMKREKSVEQPTEEDIAEQQMFEWLNLFGKSLSHEECQKSFQSPLHSPERLQMLEKLSWEDKLEHHHIEAGRFNQNELQIIQDHFHNLILERAKRIDSFMALEDKNLPVIANEIFVRWYPVPGMYGGFSYWLVEKNGCPMLMTESWCRVCGGSGQMHIISTDGYVLVGRRTDLYPDHHEYDPNGLLPEDLDAL